MKNKKGFTLVEILSVIVLIALLLGVGIPGINRISKNMKEKSLNTKKNLVEEAAVLWGQDNKALLQKEECTYIDENNNDITTSCYKISVDRLIEEDYLDSEDRNSIKFDNPTNDNTMLADTIYIYKKNNRVQAFYSKEVFIEIVANDGIKSGEWHNNDVTLEILGTGDIYYSWDNSTWTLYENPITYTTSTTGTTLYAKIEKDGKNNLVNYELKIDKTIPQITMYKISYDQIYNTVTLSGKANDDVSITGYKFTTDSNCLDGEWQTESLPNPNLVTPFKTFTKTEFGTNKYYFCVIDNTGKKSSIDADLNINLNGEGISSGGWHNKNFKINVSGTGTKECKYNGVNKNCDEEITNSLNPSIFIATLEDGVKINEMNYQVNLDKLPTITDYKVEYETSTAKSILSAKISDDINLAGYKFIKSGACPINKNEYNPISGTTQQITQKNDPNEANYSLCVIDQNGNKNKSSQLYVANCLFGGSYTCSHSTTLGVNYNAKYNFYIELANSTPLTVQIETPGSKPEKIINYGSNYYDVSNFLNGCDSDRDIRIHMYHNGVECYSKEIEQTN